MADFGQLDNVAKLREALKKCLLYIACAESVGIGTITLNDKVKLDPKKIIKSAKASLAAPPRNCDRPECATTKAAQDVWRKEDGGNTAYYEWLLATYKEGGNDGK